jgi:hypothetical protein
MKRLAYLLYGGGCYGGVRRDVLYAIAFVEGTPGAAHGG